MKSSDFAHARRWARLGFRFLAALGPLFAAFALAGAALANPSLALASVGCGWLAAILFVMIYDYPSPRLRARVC